MTTVWVEELPSSSDPYEVAGRLADLPHLLILESRERHPERGRYSFVSADPVHWFSHPVTPTSADRASFRDLLGESAEWLQRLRTATIPGLPPFQGGLAGLFGYELNGTIERIRPAGLNEFDLPLTALGIYDWVVAFDHLDARAWLIAHGSDARPREILARLNGPTREPRPVPIPRMPCPFSPFPLPGHPDVTSTVDRRRYLRAAARAIEYVHAGDCFQVNLSHRLLAPLRCHPLELYGRLRERNPAPFAGYLDAGPFQVISASPERFLQLRDGEVSTRPIKGTRPRHEDPARDRLHARELVSSEKDRAENVMIVDLLRNDLGRVCAYGSVQVPRVCEVESFRYVHHLVSEVRGRLRAGKSALDLLEATFPGGSVTGAPKVRAMEIIAELEATVRGPYCGSLGYVGFDGGMDTSILIRTFTASGGWVQFPVGGGVVADSTPEAEYAETLHKAKGMLRTLDDVAETGRSRPSFRSQV